MPPLSKGQMLFVLFLSLVWLYYLVASVPSYAAQEKNPKQLSPMKVTLAFVLGMIVSYLLVIVFSKLMKKKQPSMGMGMGGLNQPVIGGGMDDSSMGDSDMSSPDMMLPKAGGGKGMGM